MNINMNITVTRFWKIIVIFTLLFVVTRIPGLTQIYQQDEYKWARIVKPSYGIQWTIPHPPFSEFLYQQWGKWVGYDWLRVPPLIFAVLAFLLGVVLVRRWYGNRATYGFAFLSLVTTASVLASIQVDIDGAFLVFWTLLAFLGFDDIRRGRRSRGWSILIFACAGGFLTKLSFLLVPIALLIEFYWQRGVRTAKQWHVVTGVAVAVASLFLWNSRLLDGILVVQYAKSFGFLNFLERDYFEVLLLTLKTVVLFGPAFVLALYAIITQAKRYRLLLIFSAVQFAFYYVLFDFSSRTMERYLLTFVFPLAVLAGDMLSSTVSSFKQWWVKRSLIFVGLFSLGLLIVLLLPKIPLPLHPKERFVTQVLNFKLNFLIPITGGSGPMGFFVPADLTLYVFAVVTVLLGMCLWKRRAAFYESVMPVVATAIFLFALVVGGEFLFGWWYGNASAVAKQAIAFTCQNKNIPQVITYNDIGGWELGECGKYFKRFYLNPKFSETNESKFGSYKGHYLVVDMPPIDPSQKSERYFAECPVMYRAQDKQVRATVYDCQNVRYPSSVKP